MVRRTHSALTLPFPFRAPLRSALRLRMYESAEALLVAPIDSSDTEEPDDYAQPTEHPADGATPHAPAAVVGASSVGDNNDITGEVQRSHRRHQRPKYRRRRRPPQGRNAERGAHGQPLKLLKQRPQQVRRGVRPSQSCSSQPQTRTMQSSPLQSRTATRKRTASSRLAVRRALAPSERKLQICTCSLSAP